jgi:predicted ATPase/class 3 adenylate cyclase
VSAVATCDTTRVSTVTPTWYPRSFVLTDIVGSVRLWERDAEAMSAAVARHVELVEREVAAAGGELVHEKGEGDSTFSVFVRPADAVAAAMAIQRAISVEAWPATIPVQVRAGVHTGDAEARDGDWFGPVVNRAARLRALAGAGETLVSGVTAGLVADCPPEGAALLYRGRRVLRGIERPEEVWELVPADDARLDARPASRAGAPPPGSTARLRKVPIGRDDDIARVAELTRETPLVTIVGPGGIGKTTLALAVADRVEPEHADGVVVVDLAPVPPGADVRRAVADAAGMEGAAAETIGRVADHLAGRPVLLVLDNCEHVLASVSELVDRMLEPGSDAHVIATSRAPLDIVGEQVWPLGPLGDDGPVLFVERAQAAEPRVEWEATDPQVIDLCRRLDNVPLALELAAGQLRRFDLAELIRHLDDRLALRSGRAAGDVPRHATMETAIDWSYRLLDRNEQVLLQQLGVFPSWFDVDAVAASAPPLPGADLLAVFGQLVDKSLVVRLPGSGRYRLLETIRMFTRERLDDSGDAAVAFERHRRHVRQRVVAAPRLDRWLSARLGATFRADLDDARQAFHRSLQQGEVGDAVEIAVGASFLWRNAMGCTEGDAWLDDLADRDLAPCDRLWVSILRADVGQGRGDHHQMFDAAAAAEELVERVDDVAGTCLATHYGALAHLTEPAQAEARLEAVLELAHQSGDDRLVTLMMAFRAVADLAAGRRDRTRAAVSRLSPMASDDGYDRFIVHWAGWMLELAERDAVAARRWMDDQQDFLDRTGIVETWLSAFSQAMCHVLEGGDPRIVLSRTLALADREGYRADGDCVLVLAYAELCAERYDVAAELIGTAVHTRFNATAHYVLYRAVVDPALREHLDADTMRAGMDLGRERSAPAVLASYGISWRERSVHDAPAPPPDPARILP